MRRSVAAAVGVLVLMSASAAAPAMDLHKFWEGRCQECHGHSAQFARTHLAVENGQLKGRHHRDDLQGFIARHEGGAAVAGGDVYRMLMAQAQTKPVYQQKCAGCHEAAADFARSSLAMRDGVVIGRANGVPIADFLKKHGRLTADDIPIVVESLGRVMGEIGAGAKR